MNDAPLKTTAQGEQLVKAWKQAESRLEHAQREVRRAEEDIAATVKALGKWLMPPDAKDGEKVAVWFLDSLIQAERVSPESFKISLRFRGREWSKL